MDSDMTTMVDPKNNYDTTDTSYNKEKKNDVGVLLDTINSRNDKERQYDICEEKMKNNNKSRSMYSHIDTCNGFADSESGEKHSQNIAWRYGLSGVSGIIFAILNSCLIYCAWPQHHIFTHPNFWHEFMTTTVIGFIGLFAASIILNCEIWMNIKSIRTWKNFIFLYLIAALAWILANVGYYHIYCVVFKLRPPMPLNLHICGIFTLTVVLSTFWFVIPGAERSKSMFRKKYAYYVLAQLVRYLAVLEYLGVSWLFVIVEEKYQFGIAILLPIIREINGRILTAVCYKSSGTTNSAIHIICVHDMGCRHAVFLSVAITLLATKKTSLLCLGLDFMLNFFICIKTIFCAKMQMETIPTKNNTNLHILAVKEKVVCIVPISYSICFLVAYFGPNANIIGNVGNISWHFRKVEDLGPPLTILGILFLVRLVGIMAWSILLKVFSQIKYIDGYMYIQKNFWLIMAIHEAYALNEV